MKKYSNRLKTIERAIYPKKKQEIILYYEKPKGSGKYYTDKGQEITSFDTINHYIQIDEDDLLI